MRRARPYSTHSSRSRRLHLYELQFSYGMVVAIIFSPPFANLSCTFFTEIERLILNFSSVYPAAESNRHRFLLDDTSVGCEFRVIVPYRASSSLVKSSCGVCCETMVRVYKVDSKTVESTRGKGSLQNESLSSSGNFSCIS